MDAISTSKNPCRATLLPQEGMLGAAGIKDSTAWHVLILDLVTVKTVSSIMRVSDLLADHNIALLEDLNKNREPMQGTVGIYFISPTEASVRRLIFDFGSQAMHSVAHVFFSSPAPPALLAEIRAVPNLVARLQSLKEVRWPVPRYQQVLQSLAAQQSNRLDPAILIQTTNSESHSPQRPTAEHIAFIGSAALH